MNANHAAWVIIASRVQPSLSSALLATIMLTIIQLTNAWSALPAGIALS